MCTVLIVVKLLYKDKLISGMKIMAVVLADIRLTLDMAEVW